MKTITINVQEPYYSFIIEGKKTVEGRLNKGKFIDIKKGDLIELGDRKIKLSVFNVRKYNSFREMLESEEIKNVIPDKDNIDDAVAVCYRFFTKEQENEFGVVAIKIGR